MIEAKSHERKWRQRDANKNPMPRRIEHHMKNGFSLLDVIVSIVLILTLILPLTGLLKASKECLGKAERVNQSLVLLDNVVNQALADKELSDTSFEEGNFQVVISSKDTKYPQIKALDISIRDLNENSELLSKTQIFKRVQ